ncbi:L-aminopeptidase DmpA. Serine peptidase. MEROPS family S58 [Arboricoccus pini]|uniref:L-aminopeptidase DmpA. Serine peptidase. MEROPS family S58 n=1 Tax=Arboricoccus pini TaxID=1963835 RepID=A0A212QQB6_9PROT|nr:P1 family peptidase [Arboricoccus pini]SNB61609.1 L-aminopeptidase DmpA. Serine peptidase. MEROPS family S58 [Arboricoccus pini]
MKRQRLRDLGYRIGDLPTGPLNAITDIAGVRVGMTTLITDEPYVLRTGVTVIAPQEGEVWRRNLFAAVDVLNGNGEITGRSWIDEFGLLMGPIALCSTFSVGAVQEGMVAAEAEADVDADFKLPVVSETYDGWLSMSETFAVRPHHARAALDAARGGPVPEGNVGGGTGTNAHEFKAGTGTASRMIEIGGEHFMLGALVQANYGRREDLRLDGVPVGRLLPVSRIPGLFEDAGRKDGSIVVILATDAPLLPHQLKRLARRAALGLGRTGGFGYPTSGDIFLAFSTGNDLGRASGKGLDVAMSGLRALREMSLAPLLKAAVEATEEAIWNSLTMAETMVGRRGRTSHALPLDLLLEVAPPPGRA